MAEYHYEEEEVEQIKTKKGKDMSLLNQKKVSQWEMDELFLEDYEEET